MRSEYIFHPTSFKFSEPTQHDHLRGNRFPWGYRQCCVASAWWQNWSNDDDIQDLFLRCRLMVAQQKILIVESDSTLQFVYQRLCQILSLDCAVAKSAAQAFTFAKKEEFAVAIIDYMIPDSNLVEFIRVLKAMKIENEDFRIIAVIASDLAEYKEGILGAGADAWMPKPFLLNNLRTALQSVGIIVPEKEDFSEPDKIR